ncbi:alpha/beta fold hydrolase [Nocardia arthritidis]|uniref:Alpha/beta hydrolase n=1 Tax=Nocardia arthritidis TaxID=228602 RepID=A0A6G9YA29_9NOCA|nr:alpha/beta hydrolase [Nocardia arthritidis]QIS10014.1 alpha/beta hydrolase [Nocardia arthritidis]
MLGREAKSAIERLAAAIVSVRPLVAGVGAPVRVVPNAGHDWPPGHRHAVRRLLDRIARRAGVEGLVLAEDVAFDDLQVFERVVSERLALGDCVRAAGIVPADLLGEVERIAAAAVAAGFDTFAHQETIASNDGVPLQVYSAGVGEETVVLVPACGMPAALTESWVRFLSRDRRVLTWESRGLFGAAEPLGDYAVDSRAQATDLFTVMAHYGAPSAHVVGFCGGAVIALLAAALRPKAIRSLSLWHGAYGFADGGPMTKHEKGMLELTTTAAADRAAATAVHTAFCEVMLTNTPTEVAHLVLYPYASPELLYRYCRLNFALTSTDVGRYLADVPQPTLVVTSRDDHTTHPAASERVAAALPNAHLWLTDHGDHISAFTAGDPLLRTAADFMTRAAESPTPQDDSPRIDVFTRQ